MNEKDETSLKRITIAELVAAPKVYHGERVVTLAQVDDVHERPRGTAKRNFRENRERFSEGRHYFKATARELGTNFVPNLSQGGNPGVELILLTERGYLLLVKAFHDDLAWQVQEQLIEGYFRARSAALTEVPEMATVLELVRGIGCIVEKLAGMVENFAAKVDQSVTTSGEPCIGRSKARWVSRCISEHARAMTEKSPELYLTIRGGYVQRLRAQFGLGGTGSNFERLPLADWPRLLMAIEAMQREAKHLRAKPEQQELGFESDPNTKH
jgi:hypothetical protein